jgi:hypothetical protein
VRLKALHRLVIPDGGLKVKKTIIALSAAALVVAPALARDAAGKTSGLHHAVSKKHRSGVALRHEMQAGGAKTSYPGTFGYAPGAPGGIDRDLERSRQAGGGGGGGGGGM